MGIIYQIHSVFGERVLPLLIVIAAVYLVVTWKPGGTGGPVTRLFPILVDIQVALGLILWVVGIVPGNSIYLSFPFILHPLLGLIAAGIAHRSVKPGGLFKGLGRWAPLASLAVLLVIVVSNIITASVSTGGIGG